MLSCGAGGQCALAHSVLSHALLSRWLQTVPVGPTCSPASGALEAAGPWADSVPPDSGSVSHWPLPPGCWRGADLPCGPSLPGCAFCRVKHSGPSITSSQALSCLFSAFSLSIPAQVTPSPRALRTGAEHSSWAQHRLRQQRALEAWAAILAAAAGWWSEVWSLQPPPVISSWWGWPLCTSLTCSWAPATSSAVRSAPALGAPRSEPLSCAHVTLDPTWISVGFLFCSH